MVVSVFLLILFMLVLYIFWLVFNWVKIKRVINILCFGDLLIVGFFDVVSEKILILKWYLYLIVLKKYFDEYVLVKNGEDVRFMYEVYIVGILGEWVVD